MGVLKRRRPFAATFLALTNSTPSIVTEALPNSIWYKAMADEFQALQQNKTWSLVPATPPMHIVGSNGYLK